MKHWTEIDFQNWLYGLKDPDPHVDECAECRGELERLRRTRERITVARSREVSPDFLAAQRRSIYGRLEASRTAIWHLALGALHRDAAGRSSRLTLPRWHKTAPAISDEQLFSDLSAMEQSAEPKAIQPMHDLFEQ